MLLHQNSYILSIPLWSESISNCQDICNNRWHTSIFTICPPHHSYKSSLWRKEHNTPLLLMFLSLYLSTIFSKVLDVFLLEVLSCQLMPLKLYSHYYYYQLSRCAPLSLIVPRVLKILLHWLCSLNFGANKIFCTIQWSILLHLLPNPKCLHHPHPRCHLPQSRWLKPLPN